MGNEPSIGGKGEDHTDSVRLGGAHAILHLTEMLRSGDDKTRHQAILELRERGSVQVEQILAEFIRKQTPNRVSSVHTAVQALSTIGSESAFQVLLSFCYAYDYWLRQSAAACLIQWLHDPRAVSTLFELVSDHHHEVRARALEPLARTQTEAALQTILQCVPDRDAKVRSAVARALSHWSGDSRIVDPLFELLADTEVTVTGEASKVIGTLSAPDVAERLVICLESPNPATRVGAAEALGRMRTPDAYPLLMKALHDPDARVRASAAKAVGDFGDRAGVPDLIALLDDQTPQVRAATVSALGELGDPRAFEPLKRYLDQLSRTAIGSLHAWGVFAAMSRCGDVLPVAIRTLAEHQGAKIRARAADTLYDYYQERPNEQVIGALIEALGDPDDYVRQRAARGLRRIATPEALAAVSTWKASRGL
jgi:HEAT repeat protein